MPNYFIIGDGTPAPDLSTYQGGIYNGYTVIEAGDFSNPLQSSDGSLTGTPEDGDVLPGDNIVIDSSVDSDVTVIPATQTEQGNAGVSPTTTEVDVNITVLGGNSTGFNIDFTTPGSPDVAVSPTITVEGDASNINIDGTNTDGMTVNVQTGGVIGNIDGGTEATDANVINVATGATAGDINTGDGADSVTINGTAGAVNTGEGNDTITATDATLTSLDSDSGDDVVTVTNSSVTGNVETGIVSTDGGADSLTIDGSTVDGSVYTGGGADTVAVTNGTTIGDELSTGNAAGDDAGDDILTISDSTVNGETTSGGGSDTITVTNSTVVGELHSTNEVGGGDAGNDSILIDNSNVTELITGQGDDTVKVVNGSTVTNDGDGTAIETETDADTVIVSDDSTITGEVSLATSSPGQDAATVYYGEDSTAFAQALATQGFTDADGDGIYEWDGSNDDFTFNGVTYTNVELVNGLPCFTTGTMILTERGEVAIEDLAAGDMVETKDEGLQEIRWIGSRALSAGELAANPNLRPIRIKAGALGNGTPVADLVVSPQHRVLVRSAIAQRLFGAEEVLVAAKQLLLVEGIDIATDLAEVEYFHFLFDDHQVVISNGAETESLYTGPQALKSVGRAALEEIFTIFPELRDREEGFRPEGARTLLSGRQGRKLAQRHAQKGRALVS